MVKMNKGCLLLSVIVLSLIVICSSGFVLADTTKYNVGMKKYFGIETTMDGTAVSSFTSLINSKGISSFKEIWAAASAEEKKKFLDSLQKNVGNTETVKKEFYQALLKEKYKDVSVNLGSLNVPRIDIDSNMENLVIKTDSSNNMDKEFKIPLTAGKTIKLVSIASEGDGKVKLAYDPQQNKKSSDYRTLTINPGFEGSINPATGNYIAKDGKETKVNLLYGIGGEIALSETKEGKPVFGIGKLDVSKLTPAQKASYDQLGTSGLTNTAIVKIGNNFYYGAANGDSTFEPDGEKVKISNGEIAAIGKNAEGKDATLAYLRNSGQALFNPTTGSSENIVEGEIRFITPAEGSPSIVLGNKVNSVLKLYADFEDVGYDGSLANANIAGNVIVTNGKNQGLFEINAGKISTQVYGEAAEAVNIEDTETAAGGSQMECDGEGKCRFIPGRPVLNAGILAARGVGAVARGVGNVIENRPVLSFFQNRRPVRTLIGNIIENRPIRTFFAERQPVRRLVGGIIRAQPLRRAGGAILGGGGRIIGGAGRIIAFPFRRR